MKQFSGNKYNKHARIYSAKVRKERIPSKLLGRVGLLQIFPILGTYKCINGTAYMAGLLQCNVIYLVGPLNMQLLTKFPLYMLNACVMAITVS